MSKPFRALSATVVLLLVAMTVLVTFSSTVQAASTTWTTDVDFTQPGAGGSVPIFTATQVVGTGVAARVEILKDVTDWANKNPGTNPGGREGPGLVYASQAGVSILFGGANSTCSCDKPGTFKYDYGANAWTQITTTGAPPGREWPGLSYDSLRNILVLFGGANRTDGFLNDTWEFNVTTSTWTQQSPPTSPPAMADTPLVYSAAADRHIVFGQNIANGVMNTWAYNAGTHTWTNLNPPGAKPSQRSGFAIAYHGSLQRLVLFGGAFFTTLYSDTWEYNSGTNSWAQQSASGPSARAGHSMTYRPVDTSAYLFGGFVDPGMSSETWRYTSGRQWVSVGTNNVPPARQFAGFTYDAANDVGVMFGGSDQTGTILGDTWTLGAAYEAAGRYRSAMFDSGGANVVWGQIWWNKTPANQPPNTYLRFQIATASNTNPASFSFGGTPTCQATQYFTTPGTSIPTCFNNKRYLMFLGDFGSFDTQVTPSMEDVTITYTVPPSPPYIDFTDPADVTFGVPADKVVDVVFSKPMNTSSLSVAFLLGPPVVLTPTWIDGNTRVLLSHVVPFQEAKVYRLQVTATDLSGGSLVPNPIDPSVVNPWTFVTEAIYPTITNTTPYNNQGYPAPSPPVPVTQNIVVLFSEPMNTTTAVVTIGPNLALTKVWSNGDQTLTLTHPNFATCTKYTVQVNATDKSNLALVPGAVTNPWSFYTTCPNPYIVLQVPPSGGGSVATNAPVDVDFSEPMNIGTVTFAITGGITGTVAWSNGNRHLRWTHATPFSTCGVYTVTITGRDQGDNLPLIDNPFDSSIDNPWTFVTTCSGPFIMWTRPAHNDNNVSIFQEFQIFFYPPPPGQMNTASVVYTVTGGPYRETNVSWDAGTLMHIQHLALRECTRYTVQVTQARNAVGASLVAGPVPNPWSFDTECLSPYVTDTNPANNSVLVLVNQPIFVNFSAPMDTASVVLNANPPITGQSFFWSNGDRSLRVDHADMTACQPYTVFVDGLDKTGRSLLTGDMTPFAPNPWTFTTKCAGFYIAQTDPAHLQTGVPAARPINVTFSVAANPSTFQITVVPSVGTLTPSWSGGDTFVSVTHSTTPFGDCVQYTVTVSARDTSGNLLINVTGSKPNPWLFTAHCVPPQITNTVPADGATGVLPNADVIVTFSEPIQTSSVTWTITPSITLSVRSWTNGNRILTLMHTVNFTPGLQYCVTILTARDAQNNPLGPGPVPNPWCFTVSAGLPAPSGLRVAGPGPNDVILTWNAVPGAASYVVYSAQSRFQAWPWPQIGTPPSPAFVHTGAWNDGAAHFYIVRAVNASVTSGNSTMGVKTQVAFQYSSTRTNIQWVSLPYRTKYHTAKDISDELTNARIDVVGKWVPSTQSSVQWVYLRGQWRGNNFPINPGDGIYVGVRSTFSWIINGTDGAVPHAFVLYPAPNRNINWFGLPYTSIYTRASDLVIDIEGNLGPGANTRIVEVGKWDPVTQTVLSFAWAPGGWGGNDFPLAPGDGIYFRINSSFSWTPRLVTPEV